MTVTEYISHYTRLYNKELAVIATRTHYLNQLVADRCNDAGILRKNCQRLLNSQQKLDAYWLRLNSAQYASEQSPPF